MRRTRGNPAYETVAFARQCLNEARRFGKGFAESLNGVVKALFKINERIGGPDSLLQLLPGNHLAPTFQEHLQDLKGLLLELDSCALLSQLSRLQIHLERIEAEHPSRLLDGSHVRPEANGSYLGASLSLPGETTSLLLPLPAPKVAVARKLGVRLYWMWRPLAIFAVG